MSAGVFNLKDLIGPSPHVRIEDYASEDERFALNNNNFDLARRLWAPSEAEEDNGGDGTAHTCTNSYAALEILDSLHKITCIGPMSENNALAKLFAGDLRKQIVKTILDMIDLGVLRSETLGTYEEIVKAYRLRHDEICDGIRERLGEEARMQSDAPAAG